ncbi:MAG: DNA mismatch repair protein MutS [Bacteroidota bacterium]|nr:DNA mismatch repair protein MutS [Bacteroidota bacterium]
MPKEARIAEDKQTPLMKQYGSIKARYPDTVLFFRMGDFFETFGEDAVTTAKVTGIALTKRNNGTAGNIELAGFPHHQLDNYLPKMIRSGYRVAVCEQLEDPKLAKGIVRRDVVEVVTPGVQMNEKLLETGRNTYVGAIVTSGGLAGIAYADVSTGEFVAGEIAESHLAEHLSSLGLRELLISRREAQKIELAPYVLALEQKPTLTKREEWAFNPETARQLLLDHFKTSSLKGFGIDELSLAVTAAGAVLDYLRETRSATTLTHITRITRFDTSRTLILDQSTRRNLEIFFPISDDGSNASLLGTLDETSTAMGARLLRKWLAMPLRSLPEISARLDAIVLLTEARELREQLRLEFRQLGDLERLAGRFASARNLSPRDYLQLKFTLWRIPDVKNLLSNISQFAPESPEGANTSELLEMIAKDLRPLSELAEKIDRTINPEAPVNPSNLGVIRDGANIELDELRELTSTSRQKLLDIQSRERERTGISSLKVDFNGVFGYYIEVSNTHKSKVPEDYDRKQTLANAERYITPELKEYEQKIFGAEERMATLELEIAAQLRAQVIGEVESLQHNASLLGMADVLVSLATVATRGAWVKPDFDDSGAFVIQSGRHPVVEKSLPIGERFTPNNVNFKNGEKEFYVITGPNMSGKSVFLRQTGIIALLAHVGSFVPASKCTLPVLDRIFTRVGASDNLSSGESTFLVEMNEAANILNNATKNSLLLFDELGRGTSTFDGLSIAWAISEYIHDTIPGARTLFATHYHELNALADRYPRIHNLKVEVREADGKVHFLHKITPGYADHSYGIEVAAMAGIPQDVILRAREILHELEETELKIAETDIQRSIPFPTTSKTSMPEPEPDHYSPAKAVVDELREIDVNTLTPMEALAKLAEWKLKF